MPWARGGWAKDSGLSQAYLGYWIDHAAPVLREKGRGATFLQVSKDDIASLQIPLPPLAEQKRIAGILDAADALRAKRRESLAQLDTLLQSTFLDMFGDPITNPMGWNLIQLGELGSEKGAIVDGPFGSAISVKKDYSDNGDVPVIRTKNVSPFEFVTDDLKFITEEKFQTVRRSEVLPGDIILTKVGTIGHICFFPENFTKGVLSTTGSCRIRPDLTKVNPVYLARYLNAFRPQMLEIAATGVQPFLNMKHIKGFLIFLPPLDLQHRFAVIVKSAEQQKARQRAHLAELDTLFATLQQRAFNGEL
ncbi:MAG: restriction endonuclease subunit S [Deltaproteobacteria bacterium]|nr:restriction endonuclease subunit S [Deltaproteobacteria bacterium]